MAEATWTKALEKCRLESFLIDHSKCILVSLMIRSGVYLIERVGLFNDVRRQIALVCVLGKLMSGDGEIHEFKRLQSEFSRFNQDFHW